MNTKLLGAILIILGTSIGAGMLALPVVTVELSIVSSLLTLILCWTFSSVGAYCLMELSIKCPPRSNIITIAGKTLGKPGIVLSWVTCLLLLYSLMCAYLTGSGNILKTVLEQLSIHTSNEIGIIFATLFFAAILFGDITRVDKANRIFMVLKFIAYLFLMSAILPHTNISQLFEHTSMFSQSALMVSFTSFGYAVIVPSLTDYLNRDRKQILFAIFIGSAIPLLIYIAWITLIQGLVPRLGSDGLFAIANSASSNERLIHAISNYANNGAITVVAEFFMAVAVITSTLGVSISLSDFLRDGLKLSKTQNQRKITFLLSLIPPMIISLIYPKLFIAALSYAGMCCLILLYVMPILMFIVYKKNGIKNEVLQETNTS